MELIISILIAILIYIVVYTILISYGPEPVRYRLSRYFKENNVDDVQEQFIREKSEEINKNKKQKFKLVSHEFSNYIASSGIKLKANEFIIIWLLLTIVPIILITLYGGNIITGIALSIIGLGLPPVFIGNSIKKRERIFNAQLAQVTVLMGNSLRGGFTFLQSMASVAEDMQPPISTEFSKVLREIHYGVSQEEALQHMVERTKNKDLELLVSAVLTSAQVGSNLSEILDTISSTIRERIKIKQEIKTLTAQGRISGIIIGALPIFLVLIIMVISPDYFGGFFESNIGKIMVMVSIILEITGFIIINKIVNIKM
jgi:tight adherence protein B